MLFRSEDFATVMTEEAESIQRTLSNPSGVLGLELAKSAYQGHTYATSVSPTASTISLISLDDVQAHYQTLLNSARLAFVVVGDFKGKEQKKLTEMLESYFGNLEDKGFEKATIAPLEASAGADYASCEVAADTGYIAGYFACPERTSDEYVAFAIALMYLDDIMFKQVREEHGAVYSIGSGVFGGKQLLGALSVYKATEKKQLKSYILEAIESFPDSQGIADQLDRYKNKYITSLFESS